MVDEPSCQSCCGQLRVLGEEEPSYRFCYGQLEEQVVVAGPSCRRCCYCGQLGVLRGLEVVEEGL